MAINVCDVCRGILGPIEFPGDPVSGDWCFNCGRVYKRCLNKIYEDVQSFDGSVCRLVGHSRDGWRPATGMEKMEQNIATMRKLSDDAH